MKKATRIRIFFILTAVFFTANLANANSIILHLEDAPITQCGETWMESGVVLSIIETTEQDCGGGGDCLFEINEEFGFLTLRPARLNLDFSNLTSLTNNPIIVEIYGYTRPRGYTRAFLYDDGFTIDSANAKEISWGTGYFPTLLLDSGPGADQLSVSSCSFEVHEIRLTPLASLGPEFLLTANNQNTIDVHLNRGDGTFARFASVGDNLGVNYGEFAIADFTGDGLLDFIASTNENPAGLYLFTRTGPTSFEQTFLFGLDEDPKAAHFLGQNNPATDYDGYGLIAADLDNDGDMDFLENINHDFGGNKYWIAKGNAYLNDGYGNFTNVPNAFNLAQVNVMKVLSDNTWKSYDTLQTGWETPGFDDSGWRNAYAPYPNQHHPTAWIPDTEAVYMWDYPAYPTTVPNGKNGPYEAWFRKTFTLDCYPSNVVSASVVVGADDDFDFYVNGVLVHADWDGAAYSAPFTIDIKPYLVKGENVFAMYAKDSSWVYECALVDVTIEWGVYTGWTLGISSTVVDVNGDSYPDMLASEQSSGAAVSSKVYLLKGNGDGTFQQPVHVFTTDKHPATHMTLGDFNNDGKVDAIVGQDDDGDPGAAFLFLGYGDGTFEQTGIEAFDTRYDIESGFDQPGGGKFQAYDADHDGILDIISAAGFYGPDHPEKYAKLLFFHGRGDGTFSDYPQYLLYNYLAIPNATAFQAPLTSILLVNNMVDFTPIRGTYATRPFTNDFQPWKCGCPDTYVGLFSFQTLLENTSDTSLSDLTVKVHTLTNDNLLVLARGNLLPDDFVGAKTGGEGAVWTLPPASGNYYDGILDPTEAALPVFGICLKEMRKFDFYVDVLGKVR